MNPKDIDADQMAASLTTLIETFESNDAASFGMAYIRVDDYPEITEILKTVRKS